MYYDDEDDDDDPYAPRIGPAAMPSPRSKFAPYYSGHANTFEDFLEEYEGLAYDCALTDPQRVDVLIRYVAPSLRDFWRSLSGYHSRDWPLFRQSLVNIFGSTTPRPQVMRQRLLNYVQDSSRCRMLCEDDVLRYYRQFLCYSAPLVHAGHLSEEERDAAFWYGFHPDDCQVLRPRLLGKNPFQPPDIPFHFEVVFSCARAAFAYDDYFPSPWSHAKQFESPSFRRVVEPAPRDTYSSRAVTRAVASNAETTTTPDELPPSLQSPDTQLPSSSSPSVLESHHGLVHSVTLDQPEPTYTLSNTLPPSDHPLSHTRSLARSATDNDPIFASTPPSSSVSSTLLPSASPPSHTPSLVYSATDNDLIPAPTFSIRSFTFLPSASEDQLEPEPAPTLSTTLRPSASFPTPSHASPLAPSAADVPEISSTHSLSLTAPTPSPTTLISTGFHCLPSAMEDQLEPEPMCTPSITPITPALSWTSSLAPPSIDDVPEIASTPHCSSEVLPTNFECPPSEIVDQPEFEPEHASSSSITPTSPSLPAPSLALEFTDDVCEPLSLPPTPLSTSLARSEISTPLSSPTKPPPPETPTSVLVHSLPSLHPSPGESCCNRVLEPFATPASSNPLVSPSSLGELIPLLPAQHEASVVVPTPRHSTPPQRPPGFKIVGSDCSTLEVTPSFTSSIPRLRRQEPPLVYEFSSTPTPGLPLAPPPLPLSRFGLAHNFALAIVIATAFVSTLLNISKTLSTFARKFWSKYEDIGNNRIGTLNTSSRDVFAQQLRLGQYTPRGTRFVFDPGGPASSSSFKLLSAHEDIRQRKSKTRIGFITTRRATLLAPILANNLIVFNPGVAFMLDPAHEDPATFNEDPR